MKILSDKEHKWLTDKIAKLEEKLSSEKDNSEYLKSLVIFNSKRIETFQNELENLTIRRIIVGKNASGKTSYIRKHILPQLSNYFLIDPHNEYPDVSHTRKLSNCSSHPELMYNTILAHKEKVIIVEDANVLNGDMKFLHKLIDLFMDINFQFIFVYHSYKHAEWLANFANIIYDFGTHAHVIKTPFKDKIIIDKEFYNKK